MSPSVYTLLALVLLARAAAAAEPFAFRDAQAVLKRYCVGCHAGKTAVAGFDVARLTSEKSITETPRSWSRILARVRQGEMPPKNSPAPAPEVRERFSAWIDTRLRTAACSDGIAPGPAPLRRLNRAEYAATIRDLLNIHINAGHALPADGAGGEGFDNAAETLFLSPIHAEKYLEAANTALGYAMSDPRSRARFLIAEPNETTSPEQAARKVLVAFLPRAFRRPVKPEEVEHYVALFRGARGRGESQDGTIAFALRGVLVSPHFLFRLEDPNPDPAPRLVGPYEFASRLSYFLWGSMPDQTLFGLAAQGSLHEPEVLQAQVVRMLKDPKSREFAENFVEQWLGTRELGRDIKPDPKLFPAYYDAEIQSAMRYEPILFFQELLAQNLSLLNLIDSKFTILTNKLQRHYGIELSERLRQQPKRVELPPGTHRGGLLGMAAVLAVSSQPHRTSPVLRGKWILEAILGTPPPPPPPDVPKLEEEHGGAAARTLKELLLQHRRNPACASCHNRIDPLGFGLENFDVLGRWRTEDNGKPIDASGELPDGTAFNGVDELRVVLLRQKDLFVRNLTSKLLGYALGRGLTIEDSCIVNQITAELEKNDYRAQTLILGIVNSVPFRYQAGTAANAPVPAPAGGSGNTRKTEGST